MTVFRYHDHVEIVTERFADKGVLKGTIGYVRARWERWG
jgi:hypothetical protein